MKKIVCYFDGGCDKNPGGNCTASYVIEGLDNPIEVKQDIGEGTNNTAEWIALRILADKLLSLDIKDSEILIYGDSQLVVYGITGRMRVLAKHIIPLAEKADHVLYDLKHKNNNKISILWRRREYNKADKNSFLKPRFVSCWQNKQLNKEFRAVTS